MHTPRFCDTCLHGLREDGTCDYCETVERHRRELDRLEVINDILKNEIERMQKMSFDLWRLIEVLRRK